MTPTHRTPAVLTPPDGWGVGRAVPAGTFAELSDDQLLDVIAADERLAAWVTAHGVAAVGELARRAEVDAVARLSADASSRARTLAVIAARESVVDEITLASGLGQRGVQSRVEVARGDDDRYGAVREALAAGRMSWSRVAQFTDRTAGVDSQRIPGVAAKVLAPGPPSRNRTTRTRHGIAADSRCPRPNSRADCPARSPQPARPPTDTATPSPAETRAPCSTPTAAAR